VTTILIPLNADGVPSPEGTTVISGIGGPINAEREELTIQWRADRKTGVRYTITGPGQRYE
jgi:hypothetical protein